MVDIRGEMVESPGGGAGTRVFRHGPGLVGISRGGVGGIKPHEGVWGGIKDGVSDVRVLARQSAGDRGREVRPDGITMGKGIGSMVVRGSAVVVWGGGIEDPVVQDTHVVVFEGVFRGEGGGGGRRVEELRMREGERERDGVGSHGEER